MQTGYATTDRSKRLLAFSTAAEAAAAADHDLTVIIPAYNEERRLPGTLVDLRDFLDDWKLDYRVLVADDGSSDHTAALAGLLGSRFSAVSLPQHGGKGKAIRTAMLQATGQVLAFTDADLPYHLSALRMGYESIRAGECQVVFGSRDLRESTSLVPRRLWRRLASSVFRFVVRRLVSREVIDTQCGLKLFSRHAAVELFSRATIDGFAFDAEVVWLTQRLGLPFRRIPVQLIHEYDSSFSTTRHAIPMLLEVLRLWCRARSEPLPVAPSESPSPDLTVQGASRAA